MNDEQHILKQYVRDGSRDALDQLIRRYRDLVYSSAMRQVRDPHLAEDVAQAVFIVLGRKANTIREGVAIGGWLLAVTRRASVDAMRKRAIQYRHEHAAARAEASIDPSTSSEWEQIAPVIDEAMSHLSSKDRDAVVLRYFEDRPFAEVGTVLQIPEATARKRVGRAIERLRGILSRRGATLGGAALGTIITAHAVHASPVTMAISTTAASSGAVGIAKGAIHMMAWAKAKAAAIVVLGSIFAIGGGTVVVTYALAQQVQHPTDAIDDHQAIQGKWKLISQTISGQVHYQNEDSQVLITSTEIQTLFRGRAMPATPYTLDSASSHKWFDAGMPGIYELTNDTLRICFSVGGTTRPANMSEGGNPDRMLWVMTRGAATTRTVTPSVFSTAPTTQAAAGADDRLIVAAKIEVANIETALDIFEIDNRRLPTQQEGLNALLKAPVDMRTWHGPYTKQVPQDPWKQNYRYVYPGIFNPNRYDLWSAGPDGKDSTDDDIANWAK